MIIKFFENKSTLEKYLKELLGLNSYLDRYEKTLDYSIFPNIFLIDIQKGFLVLDSIPREEISKFNHYCENMWK